MSVITENETNYEFNFDYNDLIKRVINYITDYFNCNYETEVNVLLTDNPGIKKINSEFRGIDRETDVLSFPALNFETPGVMFEPDDDCFNPDTGELILGDIMISVDKVRSQAEEYNHTTYRELAFLVTHSMLHLFGFDHMEEEERIVMEAKQKEILNALNIPR